MRKFFANVGAVLLYLSVTLLAGYVPHDHADQSPHAHQDCAACELEIAFVANVPVVIVPVLSGETVTFPTPVSQSFQYVSSLAISTASRAPPVAPA